MATPPAPNVPVIDRKRCSGCGRCVAACPERLISLDLEGYRKYAVLQEPWRCTRCGACVAACPLGVLSFPADT